MRRPGVVAFHSDIAARVKVKPRGEKSGASEREVVPLWNVHRRVDEGRERLDAVGEAVAREDGEELNGGGE